jgi:hypothetical protein
MNYEDMTDEALIAESMKHSGLMHALGERLEMRNTSVFDDVAEDIRGDNITPDEAWGMLEKSWEGFLEAPNKSEGFDALMCLVFHAITYGLVQGWPMDAVWREGGNKQ